RPGADGVPVPDGLWGGRGCADRQPGLALLRALLPYHGRAGDCPAAADSYHCPRSDYRHGDRLCGHHDPAGTGDYRFCALPAVLPPGARPPRGPGVRRIEDYRLKIEDYSTIAE